MPILTEQFESQYIGSFSVTRVQSCIVLVASIWVNDANARYGGVIVYYSMRIFDSLGKCKFPAEQFISVLAEA